MSEESLEEKYEKLLIEKNDLESKLKEQEIMLDSMHQTSENLAKQYSNLVNVTFNKLFDLAADVKNQRLSNIFPQTQ